MKKTRSKYNVSKNREKRTCDGIVFDSELEKRFYCDVIKGEQNSDKIQKWDRQINFILQPAFERDGVIVRAIEYKADFSITYKNGETEYIDVKGVATSDALLKRKMFWYVYPDIKYKWVGYSRLDSKDGTGWADYDDIQSGRRRRRKEKEKKDGEKSKGK